MRSPDTVGLVRWLLDTNVVIDAFAGRPEAVKAIATARASDLEWIGYSAVTRLEVLGFPGLGAADASGLRQLLAQFSEAEISAAIIERSDRDTKISSNQNTRCHHCCHSLIYGARVTRDVDDFVGVPELTVIDPLSL